MLHDCLKGVGQLAGEYVDEGLGGERVLNAEKKYQGTIISSVSNISLLVSFQPSRLTRCPGPVTTIHHTAVESSMNYPV